MQHHNFIHLIDHFNASVRVKPASYLPMPSKEFESLYEQELASGEVQEPFCILLRDEFVVLGFMMSGELYTTPELHEEFQAEGWGKP